MVKKEEEAYQLPTLPSNSRRPRIVAPSCQTLNVMNPTMQREALRPLTRRRGQRAYSNLENFHKVFWGIKLQGKG